MRIAESAQRRAETRGWFAASGGNAYFSHKNVKIDTSHVVCRVLCAWHTGYSMHTLFSVPLQWYRRVCTVFDGGVGAAWQVCCRKFVSHSGRAGKGELSSAAKQPQEAYLIAADANPARYHGRGPLSIQQRVHIMRRSSPAMATGIEECRRVCATSERRRRKLLLESLI